uniref:Disease resistance protein RGA3 n=1 Tax=Setaria italica TaxID=4555 RepID=K3XDY1_SETIT
MAEGVVASSIVKEVLAKIGSSIWAEVALLRSFRADLRTMERDLTTIRDVLFDAEKRGGGGDSAIRDWLRRLRDVAHDIDDLLDECRTDLCASHQRNNTACGIATNLCFLRSLAMARRLRSLSRELDAVASGRDRLRLNPGIHPPAHPSAPPRRETISMVDESKTVGRTADKEKLMRLVLDAASDEDVSVIPIVGFGGLGKTTLAQLVFNDRRANDEVFDPRIWVSMSVGSSLRTLVQPTVSATKDKEMCDLDNLDAVASFLSRSFTGTKFLLVLDDVWNENQEEWEKLRMLLKDGKRGSKIIVTTRSRKVAMMVRTVPPFVLKGLSDDDCWELFRCKAFEEGEEALHPNLVNVGREIVQKCGGVPLAAKALGSMLRFSKSEQSWVDVKDSEIWQMEKEDTILPSLKLSYDQMPPGVKQCFAYCSVFPRNYEIDRDKLIQQWIALGFVEPAKYGSQSVFNRATDCFEHLLWMSFLEEVEELDLSKKELEEDVNVKYKIHHLVHDLAQSVAGDEVQAINFNQDNGHSEPCRYVSLDADMEVPEPEVLQSMLHKVRAFHSWGYDLDINLVLHARCLRVLDLRGSPMIELPRSIGKLKHLSLPDAICNLQKLQYLILSQCGILQSLPKNIGNLSNLLHLNLSQCNDLKSIPDSICRITRLHTLNMSHCSSLPEIPASIGSLKELQFLILSHHSSSLSLPISTGHLPNLQTLDLSWNIGLEELPESIGNLHNLKILILFQCWSLCKIPNSISNLVMLERLNLDGCEQLTMLPDGIISLNNLKHLRNDQCQSLERLPHGFGQWTKLETLSLLIIGDRYSNIAELENLNLLTGELRIECRSYKKDLAIDAKRANLRIKRKLSSLTLLWTGSCFCVDVTTVETFLEVLVPPENLEVLEIDGYRGTKFPSWMMKSMELLLPNLVSLSLSNICDCNCLPPLGHLPYLQSLQLRHITGVGSMGSEVPVEINRSALYQSLKELHFEDMPNLEIWPTSSSMDHKDSQSESLFMFPVLKTVTVKECPKLRPTPCLPDAIADLSVSSSSEMVSSGRISRPSSSVSASLLRRLWIKSCHVSSDEWTLLQHRPKLEDLVIEYCETLRVLPEAIRSLGTLRSLKVLNCAELEALPEWLGELVTVESLEISCCPRLASLPKGLQRLTELKELTITDCSSVLSQRCTKDTGRDWFKICHVPSIVVS